ncbi:MAG TPA: hypothetical protein DD434_09500 [Bacteroidales bacterium]|nr:hypothetical protein [Bacteroidales bacterium]
MAIRYYRKKIKVNINGQTVEKYIADIQEETVLGFEHLAEIIENNSTMSRGDIAGVLLEAENAIATMLLNGHPFNFGAMGTYYPTIQATACDNPEEVTTKTIKRFYALFKPSKFLKDKFKEAVFRLADNKVREVKYKRKD